MMRGAVLLLLLAAAACAEAAPAAKPKPKPKPKPPQFILFSHDDGLRQEDADLVLSLTDAHRNPNKCRLPATWFACTKGCEGFDCGVAYSLWARGHEIADHTVTHRDLRKAKKSVIKQEILGALGTIVACGIPPADVRGFRTPYLSDKPEVRQVLAENGFRYDSSIGAPGGSNRLWPARLNRGIPYDCNFYGQQCGATEKYPSLWEVPLYATSSGNAMDYCTNESNGKPVKGCDAFAVLRKAFDAAYAGNRGPVTVAVHSPYLSKSKYRRALARFLTYAMSKPDVWALTHSQFLDWMEAPVPASKMKAFMKKYKCP